MVKFNVKLIENASTVFKRFPLSIASAFLATFLMVHAVENWTFPFGEHNAPAFNLSYWHFFLLCAAYFIGKYSKSKSENIVVIAFSFVFGDGILGFESVCYQRFV